MRIFDLINAIGTEKKYLTLGGFYPIGDTLETNKCIYKISGTFIFTISLLEWFLMIAYLSTQLSDLLKTSEILLICMTQTAFVCKLANFIIQKQRLVVLEERLRNHLFTDVDENEEKLLVRYTDGVELLAKLFRLLCIGVVIFYGLYPILDRAEGETKKLPLPIWVPFETEQNYFYISFVILLSLSLGAWTNSNIDILTIMLITLATAQFEILKKRIRSVVPTDEGEDGVDNALVKDGLTNCIIHFNAINSFVVDLEVTFSKGIFVQFLCSVLVICLTGFQMVVIPFKSMQFILLIIYFNCMMCQIIMYCWYGHLLMESSDAITEACYSAKWFNCDARNQKMFITIMERSKHSVKLRTANFFTLNLATLMSILRSSYSYFAVLLHLYGNRTNGNLENNLV